jgi:hypothetical protein
MPKAVECDIDIVRLREVADYDPGTGEFTRLVKTGRRTIVGERMGGKHIAMYRAAERKRTIDRMRAMEHRAAYAWMKGKWPSVDLVIGHVNGDGTDNRWSNLILVTPAQNTVRRAKLYTHRTSPYKGIYASHRSRKTGKQR